MTKREYKYHYNSIQAYAKWIRKEFARKIREAYNEKTGLFVLEQGISDLKWNEL